MKPRRSLYVFVAVLLAAALVGCSRGHNDAQIVAEVQSKIAADANVPNKQIAVTSTNGVVTLAGNVGSEMERLSAANDAAQIEGVKTVVNNLQVAPVTASVPEEMLPAEEAQPESPAARKPAPRRTYESRPIARQSAAVPSYSAPAAASPAPATAAVPAPPPPPKPVTIPEGTLVSIRMVDSVDTSQNQAGDTFRATLDAPITMEDRVIVPEGAEIVGRIAEAKSSGHFAGRSELALELSNLNVNGRRYQLQTNQYSRQGTSRGKRTAATVGGGAALGAIIGGIAGGGKGAAIGATVGAGAGTGVQAATKGQQVTVPSEAVLSFRLEAPLTVTPASSLQRPRRTAEYTEPSVTYKDEGEEEANPPVLKRR